jgi:DNA-binding MarR family transcriptional regulator
MAAASWSFLTNHARVMLAIANSPDLRLRDIAAQVGITERRAHGIVDDLTRSGHLTKRRVGRRNHYAVQPDRALAEHHADRRMIRDLDMLIQTGRVTAVR